MSYKMKDYQDIKNKINELKMKRDIIEKDLIKQGLLDENQLKAMKFLKRKAKISAISKEYMKSLIKDVQLAEKKFNQRENKVNRNEESLLKTQTRQINNNINLLNSSTVKDDKKIRDLTQLIDNSVTNLKEKSKQW